MTAVPHSMSSGKQDGQTAFISFQIKNYGRSLLPSWIKLFLFLYEEAYRMFEFLNMFKKVPISIKGEIDRKEGNYFVVVLENGERINVHESKLRGFETGDQLTVSSTATKFIKNFVKDEEASHLLGN